MNEAQQTKITRWLFLSAFFFVTIIVLTLLLPAPKSPNTSLLGVNTPDTASSPMPTQTTPPSEVPTALGLPTLTTPTTEIIAASVNLVATPVTNCTYTVNYWKENPQRWLAENIVIEGLSYTKEETLNILKIETQDVKTNVLKQYFSTLLNVLRGANPATIESTFIETSQWLILHVPSVELSKSARLTGVALITALENYNSGRTGPGLCPDELITLTASPSLTQSPPLPPTAPSPPPPPR